MDSNSIPTNYIHADGIQMIYITNACHNHCDIELLVFLCTCTHLEMNTEHYTNHPYLQSTQVY